MGIKRRREMEKLRFQSCETEMSSGSSDIDDHWPRMDVGKVPKDVQRSMRSRKPVNYSFDPEDAYGDDSFDQSNQTGPIKENLSHIHGACEDGATDFSMRKECSTADFPLKENLPPDSLESEGLFCMDAGETSHPATGNHNSSDDYLEMGGGFCLDDDDDKVNVNTTTVDDHSEDHNNTGASTRAFSAMPFLRKKRKN